ncbi:MAG: aminotransferase class I/II-fold pyridoxal phosphate-dependent enzyme [Peptococcia bacterium]
MDQNKTPLVTALMKYVTDKTIPFHVPGHKQGRGNHELEALLGSTCLNIDLTCLEDTDNICNPVSVIHEAQKLAAEIYGAEEAFFLTNGTTSGIQAMILSVCEPGDKIIIPRNAHKSAIGGIILSGAEPIYIEPEIHDYYGIAMGITPEALRETLAINPDVKAVFVINPSYYGIASDLKAIVEIAHSYDVPVIVDEAHGAHLIFDDRLPLSAMEAGADLSASSTHKLGGSLTQSSILLQQGNLISPKRVKNALNLTQTTSPSYILLASLDIARKQLALHGREMIERTYDLAMEARQKLQQIPGLQVMDTDVLGQNGCVALDPTKIVVNVRALGLSGYEVEKILRKKYHLQVELSDLFNIIALVSLGDNQETIDYLVNALSEIAGAQSIKNVVKYYTPVPSIPEAVVSPRSAYYADTKVLPLEEAEGEISAEAIMAYPPGIPIVCPGERITREVIDYVNVLRNEYAILQGTEDPEVKNIKVLVNRILLVHTQEHLA